MNPLTLHLARASLSKSYVPGLWICGGPAKTDKLSGLFRRSLAFRGQVLIDDYPSLGATTDYNEILLVTSSPLPGFSCSPLPPPDPRNLTAPCPRGWKEIPASRTEGRELRVFDPWHPGGWPPVSMAGRHWHSMAYTTIKKMRFAAKE